MVTPVFQPIVNLRSGSVLGFEALIRGPANSSLHSPLALFRAAHQSQRNLELESLCRKKQIEAYAEAALPGKLFLNMSPDALLRRHLCDSSSCTCCDAIDTLPASVVIEVTEAYANSNYAALRQAAMAFRERGLQIALDDLGEGFSNLRMWSELRPDYIKIDKHFVQGIELDPVKVQFVRSILEIARQSRAQVIAEGVETEAQFNLLREVGIQYGQGYLFGRPAAARMPALSVEARQLFTSTFTKTRVLMKPAKKSQPTAHSILRTVPSVADTTLTNEVYRIFEASPDLQALAVVRDSAPIGLISRIRLLDQLARPYYRELYGNKPCSHLIERMPLIVDHQTGLKELGALIADGSAHDLYDGFIITENGRFIGIGTGFDLIREITQIQIHAARYANPLTQLPGNVPINEHIESLLHSEIPFAVCYFDLDHFKPFNDLYSYRKGDEVIQIMANLLSSHSDPEADFVGHIGGDDFIAVYTSTDWRERCQRVLDEFSAATMHLYKPEHIAAGGYMGEDRRGNQVFHNLVSVSLGAVQITAAQGYSSYRIAEFAAQAKIEAKKIPGNAMFIERRSLLGMGAPDLPHATRTDQVE
ncbi:EAL domain-containing protein [Pusillimonas sp. TS35]|nr:EAL domain-containing protein [Pusillimonas sp. TS35]